MSPVDSVPPPVILSPNVGCPTVTAPEELTGRRIRLVLAIPEGEPPDWSVYTVKAHPSYETEGQPFELRLCNPKGLDNNTLPMHFRSVDETRELMSTTLRTRVLRGYTFWTVEAQPGTPVEQHYLRKVEGEPRGTLYDLALYRQNLRVAQVPHALFLRRRNPEVKFVHLTDLHVASRNDLWEHEIPSIRPSENDAVTSGKVATNCMKKQPVAISAVLSICTDLGPSEFSGKPL